MVRGSIDHPRLRALESNEIIGAPARTRLDTTAAEIRAPRRWP
jgi:hypothetical protein